jgi:hypothetical protein
MTRTGALKAVAARQAKPVACALGQQNIASPSLIVATLRPKARGQQHIDLTAFAT